MKLSKGSGGPRPGFAGRRKSIEPVSRVPLLVPTMNVEKIDMILNNGEFTTRSGYINALISADLKLRERREKKKDQ